MNEPNKREEEEFSAEFYEDVKTGALYCHEHKIPATKVEMLEYIQKVRDASIEYGKEKDRAGYRAHLCFMYRWISRLKGDKPHDTPEKNWRTYVLVLVNYPLSPWQTGDWFEDDVSPPNHLS